jgi:hypothetical protein
MVHAQKTDFVFRRKGRVHLNRQGRQFSRLLTAEVVRISGSNAGYTYWLPTPFASFPFTSPPVRHRVPSHFNWTLPCVIPGFRCEVAENCALLGCYAASGGNFLPKSRDKLSVPTSGFNIDRLSQKVGNKLPLFATQ